MASLIDSFAKTNKYILVFFVAKQSLESACFVSVVSRTLLFCWKQRKAGEKEQIVI